MITKDRGHTEEMHAKLISYDEFQIQARYHIGIPVLNHKINGDYTITITTDNGKITSQKIKLLKAESEFNINLIKMFDTYLMLLFLCEELSISIYPNKVEVIEGFIAVFECLIEGNVIDKINWTRDFEPLHYSKVWFNVRSILAMFMWYLLGKQVLYA